MSHGNSTWVLGRQYLLFGEKSYFGTIKIVPISGVFPLERSIAVVDGKENMKEKSIIVDSVILKKLIKMVSLFMLSTVGENSDKVVYLQFANKKCNLYLENQFSSFDYYFDVQMDEIEQTIILDAKTFCEIVKNSNGNIILDIATDYANFKFGKSQYKIPLLKERLNKIDRKKDFLSIDLDIEWLNYKISCVSQCLAKDDMVPALEHVYFYDDLIVATDSIYGAVSRYKTISKFNGHTLSKNALSLISALPIGKIKAGFSDNIFVGETDNMYIQISCDGVEYPISQISSIIDKVDNITKSKVSLTFSPVEIEEAINRLCYFVDKDTPFIRMTVNKEDNVIDLFVNNHDSQGHEMVSISVDKMIADYSIMLDGKALAKTLKALGGGECHLFSDGNNGVQYLTDFETYIFFFGTDK